MLRGLRIAPSSRARTRDEAGPTNHWADPAEMRQRLQGLFNGCMAGRVMYVIPFAMGPLDSPIAKIGIEITDSPYVVVNMRVMTRMGREVLDKLGDGDFIPCLHSVGAPLKPGQADVPWPCEPDPERNTSFTFRDEPSIWSYGSGYGGNALLGKKCLALRIATVVARREGWLAEHMLILGAHFAGGKEILRRRRVSQRLRQDQPGHDAAHAAGLEGHLPRRRHCLDPRWPGRSSLRDEPGNRFLWRGARHFPAVQSERGCHVCPNSIFTNVGLTPGGDVWWEDMGVPAPECLIDWEGKEWTPDCGCKAAHPNARFTAPAAQCPVIDPDWQNPEGVPLSAILFGGRRPGTIPLVNEAFDWEHGVFLGSAWVPRRPPPRWAKRA